MLHLTYQRKGGIIMKNNTISKDHLIGMLSLKSE